VAEVHRLDGTKVRPRKARGDPSIAELLETMLEENRQGRMTALNVVARVDDYIVTRGRGTWRGGTFEAIGALEAQKFDMLGGSCVEDE